MQIRYTLLATTALCMVAAALPAQIRQYDPSTGTSIEVPSTGTVTPPATQNAPKTPPAQPVIRPPAANQVAPSPASIADGTVGQIPRLGQALVFIAVDKFDGNVARTLRQARETKGLALQVYTNELETHEYLALAAKAGEDIDNLSVRVDSGGVQAFRHKVKEYNSIIYIDPTGTRRFYDAVTEGDKFLRHVKRIEKKLKARKK